MALRKLVLNKKLREKKAALEVLREAAKVFEEREKELEADIEAAATEEEQAAVDEAIEAFEAEKNNNEAQQQALESEIADIEEEIEKIEEPAPAPLPEPDNRSRGGIMTTRTKFFGMSQQERDAFFASEEVKDFLERVRKNRSEERSIQGSELLIPDTVLGLIRENVENYSKLISKVTKRTVSGTARQNVMGKIPEAVWTDMCASLNELDFAFTQVEVDGYKVGGVIYICNSTLEDSDINLATEIINALGAAIGIALDKAILYGTGGKMPLGIVSRLAQQSQPTGYSAKSRAWEDLHTKNLVTITGKSGIELFQEIIKATKNMKGKYSAGSKIWVMNESTYTDLQVEAMSINAAGAIVSGQTMTMPVIGGEIVLVSDDIVPDGNIIAGYSDLYLLAERAGSTFATSDQFKFADDQTAYKGTARYDGLPIIAEAFIAIGIGAAPATAATFTGDKANDSTLKDLTVGALSLSPAFDAEKLSYKVTATGTSDAVTASPTQPRAAVTITYKNKNYPNGAVIKWETGSNAVTVEVKQGLSVRTYTITVTK